MWLPSAGGQESGGAGAAAEGESAVEVNMGRTGFITINDVETRITGLWNDAHVNGTAAHGQDVYTGDTHSAATADSGSCMQNFGGSGAYGMFPVCQTAPAAATGVFGVNTDTGTDSDGKTWLYKRASPSGKYVAIHQHMGWDGAKTYCERNYPEGGLASIHTAPENAEAWTACHDLLGDAWDSDVAARRNSNNARGTTDRGVGGRRACGCWIGLNDKDEQDNRQFSDGTTTTDLPPAHGGQTETTHYQQCHGFPKPAGFWYTREPNNAGSGASAETCVEIRMCFDPFNPHKQDTSATGAANPIPYAQRLSETASYQTNCPAAPAAVPAFGAPAFAPSCHQPVDFGVRTGNPGTNGLGPLPPQSGFDPRVWNDESGLHPQPFICETRHDAAAYPVPPPPPCPSPPPPPAGYNPGGQPQQQACTNGPGGGQAGICAATDYSTPPCQPTYAQAQCCCRTGQGR